MSRLCLAAAAAVFTIISAAQAQTVGFGTNPQGSLTYATGSAIGKIVEDATDLQVRVVPQGGPEVLIPLTLQGEFDFTFANTVAANVAYRGAEPYPAPMQELRSVIELFPLRLGMFVREDSGIESAQDLKGRRVAWGYTQQQNLQHFTNAYLAAADLDEGDIEKVLVPSGARALADFKEGKVDAVMFSLTAGLSKEAEAAVGGMKTLPFPQGEGAEAAIAKESPGAVVKTVEPGPAFAGIKEPTPVLTTPMMMLTSADQDDETVRKIVQAILENHQSLAEAVAAFRGFDPKNPAPEFGVPYHPAAEAVFKERGTSQ